MAKTAVERMRAYRDGLKVTGKYEAHKEKNTEARRSVRAIRSSTLKGATQLRKVNRAHKRAERERQGAVPRSDSFDAPGGTSGTSTSAFLSRQHRGKCMKRLRTALPASPRKRRELLIDLARENGLFIRDAPVPIVSSKNQLPEKNVRASVLKFYESDSVSYQSPNRRDCKKVLIDGNVVSVSVRFLTMCLKEAHALFLNDYFGMSISFSKFAELRPAHILLNGDIPHNVCTCILHENIRFLLRALNKKGMPVETDFRGFISQIVCNQDAEECMQSGCIQCPGLYSIKLSNELSKETCNWSKWLMVEKRIQLVKQQGSVSDCFKELHECLPKFLSHTFTKRIQAKAFQEAKENVKENEVIFQVDFAENYSCKEQNEVQAAHWAGKQVTIFTAVAWYRVSPEQEVQTNSFALVSDSVSHDKYSVHVYLQRLIGQMLEKNPNFKRFVFFSDGAASQFKQRFTLSNLTFLSEIFGVEIEWNFFESYHGKGSVDAIGGKIKNLAWRATLSGTRSVQNAADVKNVCDSRCPKISIVEVPEKDIEEVKSFLDNRWNNVKGIPGTQQIHHVQVVALNKIVYSRFTRKDSFKSNHIF